MSKVITQEELACYKSKLKVVVDGVDVDPFHDLPLRDKLGIYIREVFGWYSAFFQFNVNTNSYHVENRSTHDPKVMKMWLDWNEKNKKPNFFDWHEKL